MEFIRVLFRSNRAWRDGTPEQAERLAEPIGLLAERVLRQRHRAVLKAGRGFATLTEDERHAVRIALKKLRYAVGFFQTLFSGRRVRAHGKAVKRLQTRSEEHTSELQSLMRTSYAVFCLNKT